MNSRLISHILEERQRRKNIADALADLNAQIAVEKNRKTKRELETAWIRGVKPK
jgi:hypothetical protein